MRDTTLRVLLTSHLPLGEDSSGGEALRLARGLVRRGHQVRALVADDRADRPDEPGFGVRRVVCRTGEGAADLPFALPRFAPAPGALAFGDLSDGQLAQYREVFRRRLDAEVSAMDPQVIHCQHAWLHAHLALETGVPYVVSAWGPELDAAAADPRFVRFVEQSAENAGRIFAPDAALAQRLPAGARRVAGRVVLPPLHVEDDATLAARVAEVYLSVLEAWFGA